MQGVKTLIDKLVKYLTEKPPGYMSRYSFPVIVSDEQVAEMDRLAGIREIRYSHHCKVGDYLLDIPIYVNCPLCGAIAPLKHPGVKNK